MIKHLALLLSTAGDVVDVVCGICWGIRVPGFIGGRSRWHLNRRDFRYRTVLMKQPCIAGSIFTHVGKNFRQVEIGRASCRERAKTKIIEVRPTNDAEPEGAIDESST